MDVLKTYKRTLSLVLAIAMVIIHAAVLASCTQSKTPEKKPENTVTSTTTTTEHKDGHEVTPPILNESDPQLIITEVMVQNSCAAKAPDGSYSPWIEFYAKSPVNLSEYSIKYSDKEAISLPSVQLDAGEYYVLFAYEGGLNVTMESASSLTLMHGELLSQYFVYINKSKNCSYLVQSSAECTTPTPGYENALPADKLVISELMCDNKTHPIDGVIDDWIELYNSGDAALDLSKYYLSDKPDDPYLSPIAERILNPGEYVVLRTDLDFSFGLGASGDVISLTRNDGVVCSIMAYETIEEDCSLTSDGVSAYPSPGYPNGKEGMLSYRFANKGLIINEVISSNSKYKALNKEYYDIVEIYNGTGEPVNLGDYYLSDKAKDKMRFKLPDVVLEANKYHLVYCTGEGGSNPDFSISSGGERMFITRSDGYVADAMVLPYLTHNTSYGRGNGEYLYYSTPTLGAANGKGFGKILAAPEASTPAGKYNLSVSLTLSGEGKIYYTTDGSKPTASSKLYAGETITFTKPGTVRMFSAADDAVSSPEMSYTYVVTDIDYSLPVISVSVDNDLVFGEGGVNETSEKTELDARVAYFVDGKEEFSLGCGFKVFGGMTRFYVKKSFQLKFRGKYGASELNYKVFDDLENTVFNSLVIRAGGQSLLNNPINDELGTSLAAPSGNLPTVLVQS